MIKETYHNLVKPLYKDISKFILDTLFPIDCLVCGKEGSFICSECRTKLTPIKYQHCIVCKKNSLFGLTHPGCQTPHGADALISFFDYRDENLSEVIIKGKYSFLPSVYEILGTLVAEKVKSQYEHLLKENYYLVPVPLATSRKRWRGFNQAEILCEQLSLLLGWEILPALIRTKATKTQKDLKRDERIKNVSDAFAISTSPQAWGDVLNAPEGQRGRTGEIAQNLNTNTNSVKNKNLILIDDVTTTGSTLLEAAKVLKRNGAAKVICLTVARD